MSDDFVNGMWRDSAGHVNNVRYKRFWGEHFFTDEENEMLLTGKEISFQYKGRLVTGHLQYYTFADREVFGFKSNYPASEYDDCPVYHAIGPTTSFKEDLDKENSIMSEFMHLYYYSKLLNQDKSQVSDFRRVTDVELQKDGVDVTYTVDGRRYIVDEKAQMDYIYKKEPLPTFSLEILNATSGNIGWLINPSLKTEYYMFIWPHAEEHPLRVEKILYAYYSLVNKKKLLIEIEKRYKMNNERMLEYAKRMVSGKIGEEVKDDHGITVGYRYKGNGFDSQGYLYYTIRKSERPVNLVVRRSLLDEISESHGVIKQ